MDGGDFLDAVSGTQGIVGAADTVLVLKRERHDDRATLQVTSRDAAEGGYSFTLTDTGAANATAEPSPKHPQPPRPRRRLQGSVMAWPT